MGIMSLAVKRGRFAQEISTNCASFPQVRAWKTGGFGDPQRLGGPKANICPPAGGYAPAFFSILAQESFNGRVRLKTDESCSGHSGGAGAGPVLGGLSYRFGSRGPVRNKASKNGGGGGPIP